MFDAQPCPSHCCAERCCGPGTRHRHGASPLHAFHQCPLVPRFNRGMDGPSVSSRFASVAMDEGHLLSATRYVSLNPVRLSLDALILRQAHCRWSIWPKFQLVETHLFERVRDETALVPVLWHLEVANVLLQAGKRGRIRKADVARRLALISDLPVFVDSETSIRAWRETISLAGRRGLTSYEAAYLELAVRRGMPIEKCGNKTNNPHSGGRENRVSRSNSSDSLLPV